MCVCVCVCVCVLGVFYSVQNYGISGADFRVKDEIGNEDGKTALLCTCTDKGGLCTALTGANLKDRLVSGSHGK